MKIICISDTHEKHNRIEPENLPDGDVLVHAGDITKRGSLRGVESFCRWLDDTNFQHKIVIAGNHDFCFENDLQYQAEDTVNHYATYLKDDSVTINGKKFYGTPWQPFFGDWAFNVKGEDNLQEKFRHIDDDTDVLISHGPPYGILDKVKRSRPGEDPNVGSKALKNKIEEVQPDLAVFGHIHEAYGECKTSETHFVNASLLNLDYNIVNDPVIVNIK
jgi:Icc-related predicted phosphoesterase